MLDPDTLLVLPLLWICAAVLFHEVWGRERTWLTFVSATLATACLAAVFTLPAPWRGATWTVLVLALVAWYWHHLLGWPLRRKEAGPVLARLQRRDNLDVLLGFALIFVSVWFTAFFRDRILYNEGSPAALLMTLTVTQGLFLLSRRATAFELGEKGVLAFPYRVRWEEVESYDWGGAPGLTLHLKRKAFSARPARIVMPVPVARKEALEELLERYVPRE